jgi:hypothetical protein
VTLRCCPPCGEAATARLIIRYRYRRPEPVPEAMDPDYVHGSAPLNSCGSPACEATMMLATRTETVRRVRDLCGYELAEGDLADIPAETTKDANVANLGTVGNNAKAANAAFPGELGTVGILPSSWPEGSNGEAAS